MKRQILVMALLGLSLASATTVFADFEDGWETRISAAYNPLEFDMKTTVKGQEASFVSDSDDFLGSDNMGIHVRVEVWKGRLGFTADNVWANYDVQSRINSATTVNWKGYDLSTELGASYLVGVLPVAATKINFEAMGGGRFVVLKQTLDYSSGNDVSDRKSYVDPFLGARITWLLSKMWSFDVRGNVGGFSVGNASELTWVLAPEFSMHLSKNAIINLGYKAYDITTEQESGAERTQLDGRMFGPFVGAEFRFAAGQ
jgi:hypothetical protein